MYKMNMNADGVQVKSTGNNKTTLFNPVKGISFQRNCGAASVGVLQDNLVLSPELIMGVGHRKEIRKLTFQVLALHRSESGNSERIDPPKG